MKSLLSIPYLQFYKKTLIPSSIIFSKITSCLLSIRYIEVQYKYKCHYEHCKTIFYQNVCNYLSNVTKRFIC